MLFYFDSFAYLCRYKRNLIEPTPCSVSRDGKEQDSNKRQHFSHKEER